MGVAIAAAVTAEERRLEMAATATVIALDAGIAPCDTAGHERGRDGADQRNRRRQRDGDADAAAAITVIAARGQGEGGVRRGAAASQATR